MDPRSLTIFTDGASRGNPGPGGWGTIIVKHDDSRTDAEKSGIEIVEFGGWEEHTTNNRMELTAAIKALEFLNAKRSSLNASLYTDSRYLINGITKWVSGWENNGWVTKAKEEVLNRDLWEKLSELVKNKNVEWKYIGGHLGIAGNERCDEIATVFADGQKVNLYKGSFENYSLQNILDIKEVSEEKSERKTRSKGMAYSYVSMVDGKIEKHRTWSECEARVKGISGAKFKKSLDKDDEEKIIKEWRENN